MAQNPIKYFIKDLVNKTCPMEVWIQGTIEQTVENKILILSDTTARAKIKCETADGIIDKNSIKKGTYCCIIGTVISSKGLPEIQATKFIDLSLQPQMKLAWESEVRETELFLLGKFVTSAEADLPIG